MSGALARREITTPQAPARRGSTHVLQVVLSLTPGGTEGLVVEICRRLPPPFTATVCCLDDEGEWAAGLRRDGVEVVALHRRAGFRPELGRRIAAIAAARGASLLHCHQYSPFVYGWLARAWNRRLRLVYTEHGRLSDAPPSWKRRLVNPVLSRFNGSIVAVSSELREYMVASRLSSSAIQVVHNGIDPGRRPLHSDRVMARRQLGVAEGAFVVMTVARLDPVKDLPTLLDAFALVRRQVPAARLVIVGDGPERARLERRAAEADVRGSVDFVGFRSDVRAVLPAADVFVSSSISEGVSITILEAMAAGVPVVATGVGGTPEILAGSAGGVLVPSRSSDRLAAEIIGLAREPVRRAALGAAARRRVETAFTLDRMLDDYTAIYRKVMD